MFILSWDQKDREQHKIVYIYLGYICIYYIEHVLILGWFVFILVEVSIYPPLLFIIEGSLDHSSFGSQVYLYSRWFVFITLAFLLIIWSFCLLYRVCVYLLMGSKKGGEQSRIFCAYPGHVCIYYIEFVLSIDDLCLF